MVTVGQQLRKARMFLEITQKEMVKGIITTSFYSRVERGELDINIKDLILILNENHVSLRDFFEKFDDDNLDQGLNFTMSVNNLKVLENFPKDEKSLTQFALSMSDYDFQNLQIVMKKVFDLNINSTNLDVINIILINYLNRSYRENQISEIKKTIAYLKQFRKYSGLFLAKVIGEYYQAVIDGKIARAKQIKSLLKECGYQNYAKSLEGIQ
ncbi:helix-turn-helix transcriptional regulator [Lactobacillus sp.]|uniref:helix-turn-helix domain-containing protein n=1 Tax=Lactobacillus sp. TaxID=1591 RepID=UPI00198D9527|nr:helix-turn-helix transcriptional regulator [Lactobacillus sp.]MBD5430450.1 helix-turn-helix transcriptional regulator [Lactobacillus sp.]